MEERMRFVARLREGEKVVDLCREFGISRKTGQKLKKRYLEEGLKGLEDRSRAPSSIPHRTTPEVRARIVKAKKAHPTWGPKKLRAWLERKEPGLELPSAVTFGYWLKKEGLVKARGRRRRASTLTPSELTQPTGPNTVWAVDFKGEFKLGNGRYCYPLTITDVHSRYVLAIAAMDSTKAGPARSVFEEVFREYGLPSVIRSDNGCPFASAGLGGLTLLSTYWLRLGIRPERIETGHPEQNGQHERMHLTLKQETARPASRNMLQQQERFDAFREEFNSERPHEALAQRPPSEFYAPSRLQHPERLSPLVYPLHDLTRVISCSGSIGWRKKPVYLTQALAGEQVGLREVATGRWQISFMDYTLGHFDERERTFERAELVL